MVGDGPNYWTIVYPGSVYPFQYETSIQWQKKLTVLDSCNKWQTGSLLATHSWATLFILFILFVAFLD
jgi:hypothetical protein